MTAIYTRFWISCRAQSDIVKGELRHGYQGALAVDSAGATTYIVVSLLWVCAYSIGVMLNIR